MLDGFSGAAVTRVTHRHGGVSTGRCWLNLTPKGSDDDPAAVGENLDPAGRQRSARVVRESGCTANQRHTANVPGTTRAGPAARYLPGDRHLITDQPGVPLLPALRRLHAGADRLTRYQRGLAVMHSGWRVPSRALAARQSSCAGAE